VKRKKFIVNKYYTIRKKKSNKMTLKIANSSILNIEDMVNNKIPCLHVEKIGLVTRDYNFEFEKGSQDFSYPFNKVLEFFDEKGCDAVLFSLYTLDIDLKSKYGSIFKELKNIKAIFIEEYSGTNQDWKPKRYVVYHNHDGKGWEKYDFHQQFGRLQEMKDNFVSEELPKRCMGNICVLLCGETNGVKYSKSTKRVGDDFDLRKSIPSDVNIILNPIHDRMTRFEMKLKRQYLSKKNKRWVVSVWNKGKQDKNGKIRDAKGPAWNIFYNGKERVVEGIENKLNLEMGIVNTKKK